MKPEPSWWLRALFWVSLALGGLANAALLVRWQETDLKVWIWAASPWVVAGAGWDKVMAASQFAVPVTSMATMAAFNAFGFVSVLMKEAHDSMEGLGAVILPAYNWALVLLGFLVWLAWWVWTRRRSV